MEVQVLDSEGLDQDWLVSIRAGAVRKQATVSCEKPLQLPVASSIRVDVLRTVASAELSLPPSEKDTRRHVLRFPAPPGAPPKVLHLQVSSSPSAEGSWQLGPSSPRALTGAPTAPESPTSSRGVHAHLAAQEYLTNYGLLPVLQQLFAKLLDLKPSKPLQFMAQYLLQRSKGEEATEATPRAEAPEEEVPVAEHFSVESHGSNGATCSSGNRPWLSAVGSDKALVTQLESPETTRASLEASAALVFRNARLRSEIEQLQSVLEHLEDTCREVGLPQSEQKFREDPEARKFAEHMAESGYPDVRNSQTHRDLVRKNVELQVQVDDLRAQLMERNIALAQWHLKTRAKHLPSNEDSKPSAGKRGVAFAEEAEPGSGRRSCCQGQEKVSSRKPRAFARLQTVDISQKSEPDPVDSKGDSTTSEDEEMEPPPEFIRRRGLAVSSEAYGAYNAQKAEFELPSHSKTEKQADQLYKALQACPLFREVEGEVLQKVIGAMPVEEISEKTRILTQGEDGDSLYVLLEGSVECYDDANSRFIVKFGAGRIFGELAMFYSTPRKLSVIAAEHCVVGRLWRSLYQNVIVRHQMSLREKREECLKEVRMLETLSPEQIAQLADTLELRTYREGQAVIRQGEQGDEFFIVMSGECVATVATGGEDGGEVDVQEHRRYKPGELFGERALLQRTTRGATVSATQPTEALCLDRHRFERVLGSLDMLNQQNYTADPRTSILDFYRSGDRRGPRGACLLVDSAFNEDLVLPAERTDWFAVFRPTSRDAIAKMLSGVAVGKGLNVKGKSAKRGRQSGYVPFLQISKNEDKKKLGAPHPQGRILIFYYSEEDRQQLHATFQSLVDSEEMDISRDRCVHLIDHYPGMYGLDVPEAVLREVYIMRPDITFQVGWETGRNSEPAFMDMNLYGLRSKTEPKIVLLQSDKQDPRNPHGLLIAYAEGSVKPVVSDFDTFLVGSRGMTFDPLPKEQWELEKWALENTKAILETPGPESWTSRWLQVMKVATEQGRNPSIPKFGFGDATSINLIDKVVQATKETGAVRHGAECFNYWFPQELDEEYLVVWEGFKDAQGQTRAKGWEYCDDEDLRSFLAERAREGYTFPVNPVWLVRDEGWYEVIEELEKTEAGRRSLELYYPSGSGIRELIEELQENFPKGFVPISDDDPDMDLDAEEQADLVFKNQAMLQRGSVWSMKTGFPGGVPKQR